MTAQNTSNVTFWLTTGVGASYDMSAAPVQGKPTTITAATSGHADGDVAVCKNTGWSSVDAVHIVSDYSGANFKARGSDSTRETEASKAGNVTIYSADDMTKLCPSSWTDTTNAPSTINAGTFCDPTQTIAGSAVDAGTMEISGYLDACDEDYQALYEAYEYADQRYLRISLGPDQGYLVAPVVAISMNWEIPLEGAVAYTLTFAKNSATKHRFGPCTTN